MALFRGSEVSTEFGALNDNGFADGSPVTAHALRELCRNGNLERLQGDHMAQVLHRSDKPTGEQARGSVLTFLDPNWQHLLRPAFLAPRKKQGLTAARLTVRAELTNGADALLFVVSKARRDPANRPAADYLRIAGTGAVADYTKSDVIVWPGTDEEISLVGRAILTGSETLMATGTYGTPNTGTVQGATPTSFQVSTGTWNTSAPLIESTGHYVSFFNNSTDLVHLVEPRRIVGTSASTQLHFWPPIPDSQVSLIRGGYFEIRQLPQLLVVSSALDANDGSP